MTIVIRHACSDDAEGLLPLIRLLGHDISAAGGLEQAHRFYKHAGYARTSKSFAKIVARSL